MARPTTRPVLRALACLALLVAAVFGAGASAQADSASHTAPHTAARTAAHPGAYAGSHTGHWMELPPAPATARATAGQVRPAASAPTISPSVTTTHQTSGLVYCSSGDLCARVWDPTTSSWKIFFISACTTYDVYNWVGTGNVDNHQTGNVIAYVYEQDWTAHSIAPDGAWHSYDWSPIWHINPC